MEKIIQKNAIDIDNNNSLEKKTTNNNTLLVENNIDNNNNDQQFDSNDFVFSGDNNDEIIDELLQNPKVHRSGALTIDKTSHVGWSEPTSVTLLFTTNNLKIIEKESCITNQLPETLLKEQLLIERTWNPFIHIAMNEFSNLPIDRNDVYNPNLKNKWMSSGLTTKIDTTTYRSVEKSRNR